MGPYVHAVWMLFTILPLTLAQFDFSTCGSRKLCVSEPVNCNGSECRRIFSYFPSGSDWITIELFERVSNSKINTMAIGFSNDESMGDEPVTHCSFGEVHSVHLSYNDGKNNVDPENKKELEDANLEFLTSFRDHNHLYCKFRQRINPKGDNGRKFNLNKDATLLLMHSIAEDPTKLEIHSLDTQSDDFPSILPGTVNVATADAKLNTRVGKNSDGITRIARRKLILLHGCLMAVGWLFFLSVGIAASRYLKGLYKDKKPLGTPVWFQIHRAINMIGALVLLAATGIVFLANDFRWTGPTFKKSFYENLTARSSMHSLTGLIAVLMALSQPLGALFRCHPGEKYRKVFEVIHHTVGKVSFLMACISLILAVLIFHVWSSRSAAIMMASLYCLTSILYICVSEVLSRSKDGPSGEYKLTQSQEGSAVNTTLEEILQYSRNGVPRKRYSSLTGNSGDESSTESVSLKEPGLLISTIKHLLRSANKERALTVAYMAYCTVLACISLVFVILIQRS